MTKKTEKKAVVLLSGGMDSSVVLAEARDQGFDVHAITFNYGQRHVVELDAAKRQVSCNNIIEHRIVQLDLAQFGGSALTSDISVPKDRIDGTEIPVTYVPARNTIFLSIALSYAETIGARDIFIGVSSVDYSGYPDCRPQFIEAFEKTANLGTRAADEADKFKIHAPLITMTKAETVTRGIELGVDFSHTRTCYDPAPDGAPCGHCDACVLRRKGFDQAGVRDSFKSIPND